jgi:hypothetical protein
MTSLRAIPNGWILPVVRLGLLLVMPAVTARAAEPPVAEQPVPAAPKVVKLDLAKAVHLALEQHPKVAALRASLAGAQDGLTALENLRLLGVIDHEIPIRREQAVQGVAAASADLHRIEQEVKYAATRAYFSVVYAREQKKVADKVVERLQGTHTAAENALKAGARDATSADVNRSLVYLRLAQTKQVQAGQGIKRALVSLREAVGVGPGCTVEVQAESLPQPSARPVRDDIVALALGQQDDIVMSNLFTEITCLEIRAQGTRLSKRMDTFAAGGDIHSRQVPSTERDSNEYRPGGLPPEMPAMLAGNKSDRVKHACSLNERASAAALVTRNLVALEAENDFLLWEQAAQQTTLARQAAEAGDTLADGLEADYRGGLKVRVEDVVNGRVLASQARSQYNEYLFQQIIGLAELERVTGGGFHSGLSDAAK